MHVDSLMLLLHTTITSHLGLEFFYIPFVTWELDLESGIYSAIATEIWTWVIHWDTCADSGVITCVALLGRSAARSRWKHRELGVFGCDAEDENEVNAKTLSGHAEALSWGLG